MTKDYSGRGRNDYIVLKENKLSAALLCLSISIIISAIIISDGMKINGDYISTGLFSVSNGTNISVNMLNDGNTSRIVFGKSTYDLRTAATYLGITEEDLRNLINAEQSGIPYIKLGNSYVFSIDALDKWLETARVQIE